MRAVAQAVPPSKAALSAAKPALGAASSPSTALVLHAPAPLQQQQQPQQAARVGPRVTQVSKKERQEQLKSVLEETMKLTNQLKEQLRIFERKGVCRLQKQHHFNSTHQASLI